MKPFVLVGAGQYADYVQHILEKSLCYKVAAFSVTREFVTGTNMKKTVYRLFVLMNCHSCIPSQSTMLLLPF